MTVTQIEGEPPERGPDEISLEDVHSLLVDLPEKATLRARQLADRLGADVEPRHLSRYLYVAREQDWLERVGRAKNGSSTYRVTVDESGDPDFEALMDATGEWGGSTHTRTCSFCGKEGVNYRRHLPCPDQSEGGSDDEADENTESRVEAESAVESADPTASGLAYNANEQDPADVGAEHFQCPRGHHAVETGRERFSCRRCRREGRDPSEWPMSELVDARHEDPPQADHADAQGVSR